MRTLQVALRVSDRSASVDFYTAVGYELIGEVAVSALGHLTMLKLPDDQYVSLELVHDPSTPPAETGLSHIAVHVESLVDTVSRLVGAGIEVGPMGSPSPGLLTTAITDPDGRRIELVEWPPGHPEGLTAADWARADDNR